MIYQSNLILGSFQVWLEWVGWIIGFLNSINRSVINVKCEGHVSWQWNDMSKFLENIILNCLWNLSVTCNVMLVSLCWEFAASGIIIVCSILHVIPMQTRHTRSHSGIINSINCCSDSILKSSAFVFCLAFSLLFNQFTMKLHMKTISYTFWEAGISASVYNWLLNKINSSCTENWSVVKHFLI